MKIISVSWNRHPSRDTVYDSVRHKAVLYLTQQFYLYIPVCLSFCLPFWILTELLSLSLSPLSESLMFLIFSELKNHWQVLLLHENCGFTFLKIILVTVLEILHWNAQVHSAERAASLKSPLEMLMLKHSFLAPWSKCQAAIKV